MELDIQTTHHSQFIHSSIYLHEICLHRSQKIAFSCDTDYKMNNESTSISPISNILEKLDTSFHNYAHAQSTLFKAADDEEAGGKGRSEAESHGGSEKNKRSKESGGKDLCFRNRERGKGLKCSEAKRERVCGFKEIQAMRRQRGLNR
jgi:hypothetical protein